jgi:hypothetical protein
MAYRANPHGETVQEALYRAGVRYGLTTVQVSIGQADGPGAILAAVRTQGTAPLYATPPRLERTNSCTHFLRGRGPHPTRRLAFAVMIRLIHSPVGAIRSREAVGAVPCPSPPARLPAGHGSAEAAVGMALHPGLDTVFLALA